MNIGILASAVRKALRDAFNRSDTASGLGTSDGGGVWSILRGGWKIASNKAQATSTADQFALAAMDLSARNVTAELGEVSNGMGVAFWVTDAGNWFASTGYSTSSTSSWSYCCGGNSDSCCGTSKFCCPGPCSCGSSKNCNPNGPCGCVATQACCGNCDCPPNGTGCGTKTEYYAICYTGYYYADGTSWGRSYEAPAGTTSCLTGCAACDLPYPLVCTSCVDTYRLVDRTDCPRPPSNSCCTGTCPCPDSWDCCASWPCPDDYNCCGNCLCGSNCCCGSCTGSSTSYSHYLRIIKMAGGAVSSVGSDVALSSAAASIRVVTSGSNITAYGYQGADFSGLLGTATATETPGGTMYGMVHSVSSYNQGTTADSFSASAQ